MQTTLEQLQNLKQQIDDIETTICCNNNIPDKPGTNIKFTFFGLNNFEGLLLRRFKNKILVLVDKVDNNNYFGENPRIFLKIELFSYGIHLNVDNKDQYKKQLTPLYVDVWYILKEVNEEKRKQLIMNSKLNNEHYTYELDMIEDVHRRLKTSS